MPWWLKEPGHQQAWYWPNKPEYLVSSIRRVNTRQQAVTGTNAALLIGTVRNTYQLIFIKMQQFTIYKMHLKMLSVQWQPFCLGIYVLIDNNVFCCSRCDSCHIWWHQQRGSVHQSWPSWQQRVHTHVAVTDTTNVWHHLPHGKSHREIHHVGRGERRAAVAVRSRGGGIILRTAFSYSRWWRLASFGTHVYVG